MSQPTGWAMHHYLTATEDPTSDFGHGKYLYRRQHFKF